MPQVVVDWRDRPVMAGLAVAATVETVSDLLARGRVEGADTAELGEGPLVAKPGGVVAGGNEQRLRLHEVHLGQFGLDQLLLACVDRRSGQP